MIFRPTPHQEFHIILSGRVFDIDNPFGQVFTTHPTTEILSSKGLRNLYAKLDHPLRIRAIHGAKTTKNQTPLVRFS